jgi:hypothetical protein
VLTEGVVPSLHVDYKNTRIKQYFQEGLAEGLLNLSALRQIGFDANQQPTNSSKHRKLPHGT